MNLQPLTTDMGEAGKYAGGSKKNAMKLSEMLRLEREKLFKLDNPLTINEVKKIKQQKKAKPKPPIKINWGPLTKYGRKARRGEYTLPTYGRIFNYRYIKHTPEHDKRVNELIQTVITEFSEAFEVPESNLRGLDKTYHVSRVRNLVLGFIYAHVNADVEDIKRNFNRPNYSMFRDNYRRMEILIERVFFARHYSQIYKKLKTSIDYDFKTNGEQIKVNRRVAQYSRRSGRDYKLCKSSQAREMVGGAEA